MAHAVPLHSSPLASAPALPASNTTLRRFGRAVWTSLEKVGKRRASYQLEMMARSFEGSRPELARQFREAARNSLAG